MKNLSKFQETMIIQQETYESTHFIKTMINSLVLIYRNKQIKVFLKKLILQEN